MKATPAIIDIPQLGPVQFIHNRKAKKLNMRVYPDKSIKVSVPAGVPFAAAGKIVQAKTKLLLKHLDEVQKREAGRQSLREKLRYTDIDQAVDKLVERVRYWAERYGFSYHRLGIRNQKTRWGSCSHDNNINLNINLVNLPEQLMDYVIIHELVHTRHKHHGPAFWQELSGYVGDARELCRQLRNYRPH